MLWSPVRHPESCRGTLPVIGRDAMIFRSAVPTVIWVERLWVGHSHSCVDWLTSKDNSLALVYRISRSLILRLHGALQATIHSFLTRRISAQDCALDSEIISLHLSTSSTTIVLFQETLNF